MRILYILGNARSGTTTLSAFLGDHPEMVSVGELKDLPLRAWLAPDQCSCGAAGDACEFWSLVRADIAQALGRDDVRHLAAVQARIDGIRRLPEAVLAARRGTAGFSQYATAMRAVFESVSKRSGAAVVVDSSKSPSRAFALDAVFGDASRFVHMVRDPRGAVWSTMKHRGAVPELRLREQLPRTALRSAATWVVTNLSAEWMTRRTSGRARRVRYEDFVREPALTLRAIAAAAAVDGGRFGAGVSTGVDLTHMHIIAGNRMRLTGTIRIQSDDAWRQKMPRAVAAKVWALTGWLARRYGYVRGAA